VKRSMLIVFVLLLAVSTSGLAQQSNVAEAVYNKWRQNALADEVSKLRFALASVARRTDDGMAEVELWAVGRGAQPAFEIRAVYFEGLRLSGLPQDARELMEQVEEITKTPVVSGAGDAFGLKVTVPVRPDTNALEIKWFGDANGARRLKTSVTVFLGATDKPGEALTWRTDRGGWTMLTPVR
jgi:hypothetical protein